MSGRAGQAAHSLVLAAARGAMAAASEAEKAAAMTAFLSLHTHPPATGNCVNCVLCKGVVCVRCPTLEWGVVPSGGQRQCCASAAAVGALAGFAPMPLIDLICLDLILTCIIARYALRRGRNSFWCSNCALAESWF